MVDKETRTYLIGDQAFQQTARDWITEDGEVWIEGYIVRGGGFYALITTPEDFDRLLHQFTTTVSPNSLGGMDVFRHPRFLLRGIVDDDFIAKALATFSDADEWMSVCRISDDPLHTWRGSGDIGHKLLLERLEDCRGKYLILGQDFDWPNPVPGTPGYENQILIHGRLCDPQAS